MVKFEIFTEEIESFTVLVDTTFEEWFSDYVEVSVCGIHWKNIQNWYCRLHGKQKVKQKITELCNRRIDQIKINEDVSLNQLNLKVLAKCRDLLTEMEKKQCQTNR